MVKHTTLANPSAILCGLNCMFLCLFSSDTSVFEQVRSIAPQLKAIPGCNLVRCVRIIRQGGNHLDLRSIFDWLSRVNDWEANGEFEGGNRQLDVVTLFSALENALRTACSGTLTLLDAMGLTEHRRSCCTHCQNTQNYRPDPTMSLTHIAEVGTSPSMSHSIEHDDHGLEFKDQKRWCSKCNDKTVHAISKCFSHVRGLVPIFVQRALPGRHDMNSSHDVQVTVDLSFDVPPTLLTPEELLIAPLGYCFELDSVIIRLGNTVNFGHFVAAFPVVGGGFMLVDGASEVHYPIWQSQWSKLIRVALYRTTPIRASSMPAAVPVVRPVEIPANGWEVVKNNKTRVSLK